MTSQTVRRLLQLVLVLTVEIVFFALVEAPLLLRLLAGLACGLALTRHWKRADNPRPKHSRKRLGPPMEWIDR